jgi:hypothetical protein
MQPINAHYESTNIEENTHAIKMTVIDIFDNKFQVIHKNKSGNNKILVYISLFQHIIKRSISKIKKNTYSLLDKTFNWVEENNLSEYVLMLIIINIAFLIVLFVQYIFELTNNTDQELMQETRKIIVSIENLCNSLIVGYLIVKTLFWLFVGYIKSNINKINSTLPQVVWV